MLALGSVGYASYLAFGVSTSRPRCRCASITRLYWSRSSMTNSESAFNGVDEETMSSSFFNPALFLLVARLRQKDG